MLHDTLWQAHQQYDSICVLENHTEKYRPSSYHFDSLAHAYLKTDTLYRDRTKTEFRYKLLHDTTYIHRVDTVPKVIRVESPPKIRAAPAALRWLTMLAFLLFLLALLPNRK